MCTPTQGCVAATAAGCVSACELVCVCVSLVRVVIICPASTHTALVSSPSLTVVHLSTYIHRRATIDTSLTPHTVSSVPRRPARLLEAEQACSSLAYYLLSSVVMLCPCLFLLAPWSAGGGDRKNVALSYVYADSGCVAASWLCVL